MKNEDENIRENQSSENDDKASILKGRIQAFLIIGVPWILIIIFFVSEFKKQEASKRKECVEPGCHNERVDREIYCSYHLWKTVEKNRQREQERAESSKKAKENKNQTKKSSTSVTTGKGSTVSSNKSSTKKNYKMNDPMDYDSPEDFADDAWGTDFDNWDDAYDYWEDVMD